MRPHSTVPQRIDSNDRVRAMIAKLFLYQLTLAQAGQAFPEAEFDLRRVESAPASSDTIVVTGRRMASQRLIILPDLNEPAFPRAETRLFGNVRLGTDVEPDAGGSPRVMLKLKIPF